MEPISRKTDHSIQQTLHKGIEAVATSWRTTIRMPLLHGDMKNTGLERGMEAEFDCLLKA